MSSVFQIFSSPFKNEPKLPEYIIHNELILEIINNWNYITELFEKYETGSLTNIDQLDSKWMSFFIKNNIKITDYKNEEEFKLAFWKIPEK